MDVRRNRGMSTAVTTENEKLPDLFDKIILFSLAILILVLPVAHTATIRAIAIFLPVGMWFMKMAVNRKIGFNRTPLDIPILLYIATGVLSILSAVDPGYTIRAIKGEMIKPFLLFFLTIHVIRQEKQVKTLLFALFTGAGIMTIYGIYDFFIKGGSLINYGFRAHSLHVDFQYFATYLVLVFPFLVLGVFSYKKWMYRSLFIFLSLLTAFSVYITHTRAAWIALFVELVFIALIMIKRKWILVILFFMIACSVLLVIPRTVLYHAQEDKETSLSVGDIELGRTDTDRFAIWCFSLKEIAKRPFMGIGFGKNSFSLKYETRNKDDLDHSHNAFFDLALQLGIQGLLVFIFMMYILMKTLWLNLREGREGFYGSFTIAALVMTVGYLVRNIFDSFLLDDSLLMFWLFNGLALSLVRTDNYNRDQKNRDKQDIIFFRRNA